VNNFFYVFFLMFVFFHEPKNIYYFIYKNKKVESVFSVPLCFKIVGNTEALRTQRRALYMISLSIGLYNLDSENCLILTFYAKFTFA
jgi:hypothetical protein